MLAEPGLELFVLERVGSQEVTHLEMRVQPAQALTDAAGVFQLAIGGKAGDQEP